MALRGFQNVSELPRRATNGLAVVDRRNARRRPGEHHHHSHLARHLSRDHPDAVHPSIPLP